MRPQTLGDFVGQEKVVGETSYLRRMIEKDMVPFSSEIPWHQV